MKEPGDEVLASVPPYVSRWLLEQMSRGPVTTRTMRAHAAYLRGIGRRDLADRVEFGWRQLLLSARGWEDAHDLATPDDPEPEVTFASESGPAKAADAVRESTPGTEIATKEAAEMLKVSAQRVGQLVKAGVLSGRKVGSALLVDRASVEQAMHARRAS